jgi:hypothetical protein
MPTTTETIKSWFEQALLSRAAYGLYGIRPEGAPELSIASVKEHLLNDPQTGMTPEMADYFVRRYALLAHQPNTFTGYSGTLFARRQTMLDATLAPVHGWSRDVAR